MGEDIESAIEFMDKDQNGKVSLEELIASVTPPSDVDVTGHEAEMENALKTAKAAFPKADKDNSGDLDATEFVEVFKTFTQMESDNVQARGESEPNAGGANDEL